MAPPSRRDDLVKAALRLFLRDGFHATGIAAILAEAETSKMTLYSHFASKEALIAAALAHRDALFRRWLFDRMRAIGGPDPKQQLLAMFDAVGEWIGGAAQPLGPDFVGCAFVRAAGEFVAADHPLHRQAAGHKQAVLDHLVLLCAQAGLAIDTARQLALLKEGAIAEAFVRGDADAWKTARVIASRIL
ncbi:TetR/AcrR family transcriptional regulator [Magnetospirillum sulfuroxidans]|uniref:TetR/AcrR family transcriptional regulator n=1 Tax=Magnetospirillum sulfuroxidans TaxID=611300 RepID=A0ABS5IBD3_9PROT|nr:TetR family transcriptional regulator [Magnetospirillum sulfuroxidans]MBR9971735.1 TetR/AcrR family transcriptional regulator [Magnetospirillum sulfuroxidans]